MKNILLILLTLTVAPVWAEDVAVAPSTTEPSAQATQTAPDNQANCIQMAFLSKNISAKTSSASATDLPEEDSSTLIAACPTGCALFNCPPPGGPLQCCSKTTFQPCY